jgi:hypothetical protein
VTSQFPGDTRACNPDDAEVAQDVHRRLRIYVVATTDEGTRAALLAARSFGADSDPDVVLLVPHAVPYPQPLDCPPVPVAFTIERFERLANDAKAEVLIRVCVARPGELMLEPAVPEDAVLLVGGTRGRWWRSREQRLAGRFADKGHCALFVGTTDDR